MGRLANRPYIKPIRQALQDLYIKNDKRIFSIRFYLCLFVEFVVIIFYQFKFSPQRGKVAYAKLGIFFSSLFLF